MGRIGILVALTLLLLLAMAVAFVGSQRHVPVGPSGDVFVYRMETRSPSRRAMDQRLAR